MSLPPAAMQVDFSTPESEHHPLHHLSPHAHAHYEPHHAHSHPHSHPHAHHTHSHAHTHTHTGGSGSPAFSPFRHPGAAVPAIDPSLEQASAGAPAHRNGHAQMSQVHHTPTGHLLQPDNAGLGHQFYGDMSRASQTPSTPSNASPRFSAISPTSQPKQVAGGFVPNDRSLPSRDVADDTIDDAYAAFILYCNPSFPVDNDTAELTKLFRQPPKSDGKAFSTWTLFELLRRLDAKELKTWSQLALELGVEPPDIEKGQSTQKVQQYSVRLKVSDFSVACQIRHPPTYHFATITMSSRAHALLFIISCNCATSVLVDNPCVLLIGHCPLGPLFPCISVISGAQQDRRRASSSTNKRLPQILSKYTSLT